MKYLSKDDSSCQFEGLGVFLTYLCSPHSGEGADEVGVHIVSAFLGFVSTQSGYFPVDVLFVEDDEGIRAEVDIVPDEFIAVDGSGFECPHGFVGDGAVILVDIAAGGNEDDVGIVLVSEDHEQFEQFLADIIEFAHFVFIDKEVFGLDAEEGGGFAYFDFQLVGRIFFRYGLVCSGEGDIIYVGTFFYGASDGAAAAKLAVVGMGGEDKNLFSAEHRFKGKK